MAPVIALFRNTGIACSAQGSVRSLDALRGLVVAGCALALIFAGAPLPA